jgi:hypothetical protein
MKYFIAFMLFFLTNCFVPTGASAAINSKNGVTHSVVFPAKKLSYKERVRLKYLTYRATFKQRLKKSRGLWITAAIFLTIGIWSLSSARPSNNTTQQQVGARNEPTAMIAVLGALSLVFGIAFLIAALVMTI